MTTTNLLLKAVVIAEKYNIPDNGYVSAEHDEIWIEIKGNVSDEDTKTLEELGFSRTDLDSNMWHTFT